jgi:hypothetical protein
MGVVGSRLPTLRPSSEHQATPASDINTQWGSAWTFWDAPSGKFVRLGGMHSNLLAVGSDGALYCWPWSAEVGETVPYHRSEMLGLVGQEVISLWKVVSWCLEESACSWGVVACVLIWRG